MDSFAGEFVYLAIGSIFMLTVIGLVTAIILPGIDRWGRRCYIIINLILMIALVISVADLIMVGKPNLVTEEKVIIWLEDLGYSLLYPMIAVLHLYYVRENWKTAVSFRVTAVLWGVFFILHGIGQFTTCFYYITPENIYCQGPLYLLLLTPLIAILLIDMIVLYRKRRRLSRKQFCVFMFGDAAAAAFLILEGLFYNILLVGAGMSIGVLIFYVSVLTEQIDEYLRQQRKIANQHASITVLQMRPHFIYNTMASIYYLCEQDPKKAQQVILDFTAYLRKNFNAIASEEMIPFSEELEHVRAYLGVERVLYKDRIVVEYDTPHTEFRVPPLTLQPLVENAVKHGFRPDSKSLNIVIRTRKTDSGSVIFVEDDGSGVDRSGKSGLHIALSNIKQRLEMMCHGSIEISPREGGGTVAKVTLIDDE